MSDIDPQQAARMALEDGAADAVGEAAPIPAGPDAAAQSGVRGSLIDGLLETEPAATVHDYPDMPPYAANAIIGTVKFINGIVGDRRLEGGKPAIVNWTQAVVGFYAGATDDGEPEEPEPDRREAPPVDAGGELNA